MSSVTILNNRPTTNGEGSKVFTEVAGKANGMANGSSNGKAGTGRRKFGENGFEEQGGYMAVKKAKLDNQFNNSTRVFGSKGNASEIFSGLSIYINGYTNPPEPELRELFVRHGGTFHPYTSTNTTYVIATNLSAPSKRLYAPKTLTPDWIMESIAAQKVLDSRDYLLYDLNREKNQKTLTQIMVSKKPSVFQNEATVTLEECSKTQNGSVAGTVTNGNGTRFQQQLDLDDSKEHVSESEEEFFECSQEFLNNPYHLVKANGVKSATSADYSNGLGTTEPDEERNTTEVIIQLSSEGTNGKSTSNENGCVVHENGSNTSASDLELTDNDSTVNHANLGGRIKTATDEGFIEDFFGRSRLHLISEQKKEMQTFVGALRKNIASHSFHNLKKFESEVSTSSGVNGFYMEDNNRYLMHIDLDCFFVSVGLLSRPHLRGKPVVVTHSSGKVQESKSDIACASYEARKFGIKNGMWVGDAKSMCPNLEVISYDFDEYRRVSKRFFEAVATVTLDIEPNSVDEMIVDVTEVLKNVPGSTPESLAAFIRRIILEETKCPASIGIGSNKLLAKLAVKLAKPDGIHHLKNSDAASYIESLNVRDLPGIGWSNEEKLSEKFKVETCGDLLKVPLKELKIAFGEKTAERLHSLCQGIDTSEMKFGMDRPKSISVDVNFGIRFTKDDDVTNFIIQICKELGTRAERIQARSTHFTLKLLIRKKGAGEPLKHGGHGIVDSVTRSRTLFTPTRNWQELYKTACSLIRLMRVPPVDYRGVGVTLSDLTFDCDKTGKKSVQRTLTDMPISSRAHQMLSLSKKKTSSLATGAGLAQKNTVSDNVSESNSLITLSTDSVTNGLGSSVVDSNATAASNERSVITSTAVEQQPVNDSNSLPVDINVLRQLPREIAEEQCQIYGISKDLLDQVDPVTHPKENGVSSNGQVETMNNPQVACYYDDVEAVDESFLSALPDSVRQDVLIHLQEAKGRRNTNLKENTFDDEQPCTSKQAIERSKRLEEQRKATVERSDTVLTEQESITETGETVVQKSPIKMTSLCPDTLPLEEQTTPIIESCASLNSYDPKSFWDINVKYQVLPPQKMTLPALNNFTEIADVRNLIRQGLEVVSEPTKDDFECLDKYFKELVANGWLNHTQVLLKFLQRRIDQMGESSKWTPILARIIEDTQRACKRQCQGVLDLEL